MRFKIDRFNLKNLFGLADFLYQEKAKELEIEFSQDIESWPRFSEAVPDLYPILDYEAHFQVWLKNFPYCVWDFESIDHVVWDKDFKGEKAKKCQTCFWNKNCRGFPKGYFQKYGQGEICPMPDLPFEVMIEATPKCNFNCQFCFNQVSFARNSRNIEELGTGYLKKIINHLAGAGIKIVRLTGGEPLLRKDIFELLKYAKNKGLETRLNTNASLVNKRVVGKLKGILDNVLIPIESHSQSQEAKITGNQFSLKKKIRAIELFKKAGIPVVRAGTVANRENILNFDKLSQFVLSLLIDEWELYRPAPISKKSDLNSKLVKVLVDKLFDLRKRADRPIFIANALPFCTIRNLNRVSSVCKGAWYDDGHTRLVIDPRDFVKPHYFLDRYLGRPLDIPEAWHHPFVEKMRNLEYLPLECRKCAFAFKCRGGSRQAAKAAFGSYRAKDPLANFKNLVTLGD